MEDRLDTMSTTLFAMKELLMKNGITDFPGSGQTNPSPKKKGKESQRQGKKSDISRSETTVYKNALNRESVSDFDMDLDDPEITFKSVEKAVEINRQCCNQDYSSDERIDTSDELMEVDYDIQDKFISGGASDAGNNRKQPHPEDQLPYQPTAREQADNLIRANEKNKIEMLTTPGRFCGGNNTIQLCSAVDENYMVIGMHLESNLREKIKRGEYVDFAKLLPKDKLGSGNNEGRLELINRGGQTFFVPVDHKDNGGITNFNKWEQAFRIYSNIYSKEHPERASELIQYNHVIFTAASTYVWENVYMYDREFRMHVGCYPERNWSIILQQAWSMYLKDRVNSNQSRSSNEGQLKSRKDYCKKFNRGQCTAGRSDRYEHRCFECNKFGHGVHICRRRQQNHAGSKTGGGQATASPPTGKH